YEPGVAALGGAGDAQTFVIRGMGENRVKIVRDGVRQNDAYKNGGVGQSYFDTDMIKQVEVVKGPASAAYGSDALGGVIAYETVDAADLLLPGHDTGFRVYGSAGTGDHSLGMGASAYGKTDNLDGLLSFGTRDV
ncbi:TonB-dependent receptor plug domain-containing protein, partial [Enterobacter bugandensis]|uniref:TonB-dependent receptor plug domain-containing protein n=1 Tax=Enterobacter bugandensis TaxID=881260 RepID=UPI002B051E5F